MPSSDWFIKNSNRAYPFKRVENPTIDGLPVPEDAFVDFGLLIGILREFDVETESVYLRRLERSGNTLTIIFRVQGTNYSFTRDMTTTMFGEISWNDVSPDSLDGFLVTGDLQTLWDSMGGNGTWTWNSVTEDRLEIEPATIQTLQDTFARTINLANGPTLTAALAPACGGGSAIPGPATVVATDIVGEVEIKEGYNCAITFDSAENVITIAASVGAGAGEHCGEMFVTGGPDCDDLIYSIGGVASEHFMLVGTNEVVVTADAANHRIIIDVDLTDSCGDLYEDGDDIYLFSEYDFPEESCTEVCSALSSETSTMPDSSTSESSSEESSSEESSSEESSSEESSCASVTMRNLDISTTQAEFWAMYKARMNYIYNMPLGRTQGAAFTVPGLGGAAEEAEINKLTNLGSGVQNVHDPIGINGSYLEFMSFVWDGIPRDTCTQLRFTMVADMDGYGNDPLYQPGIWFWNFIDYGYDLVGGTSYGAGQQTITATISGADVVKYINPGTTVIGLPARILNHEVQVAIILQGPRSALKDITLYTADLQAWACW